jgi:hypothetical protein
MHQLRMSSFNPFCGWTSSLLVEIFFFHLLSAPNFSTSPLLPTPSYLPPTNPTSPPTSTLLPTTYQPHPPSLHRQSSRDLERLWSGSWSCGCGAGAGAAGATGARAGPVGVGAGPMRPRKGKMLTFFFCFFCLFCLKKAWEVFFFLFLCCTAA